MDRKESRERTDVDGGKQSARQEEPSEVPLPTDIVKPGDWIDTGRYRPARVLEMMADWPHAMRLSYGDKIDEYFLPHITEWGPIRQPPSVPSLKDVFSPGDWIRHSYSGYGRVVAVRNSTMDVDYRGRMAIVVPDAKLSKIQKVDGPEPDDPRPVAERFTPGTWIEQGVFGQGVVLYVQDDVVVPGEERPISVLNVCFIGRGVIRIVADDDGPFIRKMNREPLDLAQVTALKNGSVDLPRKLMRSSDITDGIREPAGADPLLQELASISPWDVTDGIHARSHGRERAP